jgi:hypothetical protein
MTRDEIRALAIERVANAIGCNETGADWRYCGGEEVIERATLYVDALGDLLPTQKLHFNYVSFSSHGRINGKHWVYASEWTEGE